LTALGVSDGVTHTELMLTKDGPMIIEVNGRAGGPIPELISLCSDADLAIMAARVALGIAGAFERPNFDGYAMVYLPRHPVGVWVESVEGIEALDNLPGVVDTEPINTGGQSTLGFLATAAAAVHARVSDPEDAVELAATIDAQVVADYRPLTDRTNRLDDLESQDGEPD
jgi:hypothetical protein